MRVVLTRRASLMVPLLLAACGDDAPAREFSMPRYDYLTRLQINVASIGFADLPPPGPLDRVSPVPAGPALRQMVEDRLAAGGSSGRAVVTIEDAAIARSGGGLDGTMAIRIDILSADGGRVGFAEARVARRTTGIGRDLRGALYDITKQMLDDMNVELEFQLRRSLRDYLQATAVAPAPAAVQQQDLAPPRPAP